MWYHRRMKAKITFNDGKEINLELYPDIAPKSVERFVGLARAGYYNGTCFHRIIDRFMIQGGGMKAFVDEVERKELPAEFAQPIKGEFDANGVKNPLKHTKGVLSMARTMINDSATSQFFICVADVGHLDGQYAAFGKCVAQSDIDVAVAIGKVATGDRKSVV